ncbi:MAG: hypothetical protein KGM46_05855 [Pseudomonadota bacterium]|nr:hypothetical protein [Pseudomonadota bacterium]
MPNGRCYVHGGPSTGPKRPNTKSNAITHGIYVKRLSAEEEAIFPHIEVGHVDLELRLARIRLARALAAEHAAQGEPELLEVVENDGGGEYTPARSEKRKVRDYTAIIDRLMGRIESLERTRKLLDAGDGGNDDIAGFETRPYEE